MSTLLCTSSEVVPRRGLPFPQDRPAGTNVARDQHKLRLHAVGGASFHSSRLSIELATTLCLGEDGRGIVTARFAEPCQHGDRPIMDAMIPTGAAYVGQRSNSPPNSNGLFVH